MSEPTVPDAPADTTQPPDFDPGAEVPTNPSGPVDPAQENPDDEHPGTGPLIDPDLPPDAEFHGPYDAAANGTDAEGNPLNAYGRTEAMNAAAAQADAAKDAD